MEGYCNVKGLQLQRSFAPAFAAFSYELEAQRAAAGLGWVVDLLQHLMHHAKQRAAQAEQLRQEDTVPKAAPYVAPHGCERLARAFKRAPDSAGATRPQRASGEVRKQRYLVAESGRCPRWGSSHWPPTWD